MLFWVFCAFRFFSPLTSKASFLLDVINCQQSKHIFVKFGSWMKKTGRGRLLYEVRPLDFLCQNLLTHTIWGTKSYLWQWPLSNALQGEQDILLWHFDDFQVFHMEINFAVNVYGNMLIENWAHDCNQSYKYKHIPWEHGFFFFFYNCRTKLNTIKIKRSSDCLHFYFHAVFDIGKTWQRPSHPFRGTAHVGSF